MKGQVILKNLQWLGRHNPAFPPGSVQTAVAELLNPTSSILPYSARLCLNKPGMLCTGKVFFNIEAGKTKSIPFSTEVPTVEGTYPVYLDVFSNDQLLEAYRAAEDIIIRIAVEYTLEITVEPPGAGYVTISPRKAAYSAGEKVTLTANPYSGYEFDHWGGWPPYPGVGSTSRSIQITMTADWWVVAAFREVAPPPVYTCTYCGATFASEAELNVHTSAVHAEELLYANWLRTGGTGTIEYWRSIGSPLYYTPPPPIKKYHYRVTFLDGSQRIISWEPDPVTKPNLWDFVSRSELLSWEYLGLY